MAMQGFYQEHWSDENGNPAGGVSTGRGFTISWQNGPMGAPDSPERRESNGGFVEDVIQAVIGRIEFYQSSKFACPENAEALEYLKEAAAVLDQRTQERIYRNVEGTHSL